MAILEIFETSGAKQLLRPSTRRDGPTRAAVVGWAQDLSDSDEAPFEVKFQRKLRGHELYEVKVGARLFSVVVH